MHLLFTWVVMQHPIKRTPKQARAQNTINRILEATVSVIETEGLEATTTNRIAQKAHVNISSLYQYFPNREAVFMAVLQQHFQTICLRVDDPFLEATRGFSLEQAARFGILEAVRYLRSHPSSLILLLWSLKQPVPVEPDYRLQKRGSEEFRRLLVQHRDIITATDIDRALEVGYVACTSILHWHLSQASPFYSDEEIANDMVRTLMGIFLAPITTQIE